MRIAIFLVVMSLLPAVQIPAFSAQSAGPANVESVQQFSDGLAGVSVNGKWGFIDEKGKMAVAPEFHEVLPFNDGYASVRLVSKWGLIDKKGRYVVNPEYDDMGVFAAGLVAVKVGGKWGYIDKKDKMIIPAQFSEALPFSTDLAAVRIDSTWGFIDSDGRYAINPRFSGAGTFASGLAPVKVDGVWGFIDKKGNLAIKPQFQKTLGFSDADDLAAVQEDSLWGFIDTDGRFEINPQYENAGTFAEGRATVQKDGKWGFIDRKGQIAVAFQYQEAGGFSNGRARVVSGAAATFIAPSGKDAGVGVSAGIAPAVAVIAAAAPQKPAPVAVPVVAAPQPSAPPPAKAAASFTVTPLPGPSGTINPDQPQSVAKNATVTFTIKPAKGATVTTPLGGTCGGTFTGDPSDPENGITFTTNPITYDCTVAVPSVPPLTAKAWQNTVVPKHRAIVTFMDTGYNIRTFRGQNADLKLGDSKTDFSKDYDTDSMVSKPADLGVDGSDTSRVFSMTQAAGVVPQTVNLADDFMGTDAFTQVPTGMLCTAYLSKSGGDGKTRALWMELTGLSEKTKTVQRIGRVKLDDAPTPYFVYHFNADLQKHYDAPNLDRNVGHDMVSWDWNGDGYSDYLVSYLTNPEHQDDYKNMKVALVWVDGKSLYEASQDPKKKVSYYSNWDFDYTTGTDIPFGVSIVSPPNSVRMAVGDMDGDGKPEVSVYFTKVKAPKAGHEAHDNTLAILRLNEKAAGDTLVPYAATGKAPVWTWLKSDHSGVGRWLQQWDSVSVAMGDLDGDGRDELAVLHGLAEDFKKPSTIYLDVYKMDASDTTGKTFAHPINGEEVGDMANIPNTATDHSHDYVAAIESSIADLDGDGFGELVWVGTYKNDTQKIKILVHKWPVIPADPGSPATGDTPAVPATPASVKLTGMGTQGKFSLTDAVPDWTLDKANRFSMDTGRFVYPEKTDTGLREQIAVATTLPKTSSSADDTVTGFSWGIFKWDWDAKGKAGTLTLLGNGKKKDIAIPSVVPFIAAADLDRDSMVLGQPTLVTVTEKVSPVFIIQAPPRHFDQLSEILVDKKNARGQVVKDKDGNAVKVPMTIDAFSQLEDYSTVVTQGSEKTYVKSTSKPVSGDWGASANYELRKENLFYEPPPLFSAGASYAGNYEKDTTTTNESDLEQELEATAEFDDQLYYTSNDLDVWFYPVLYPASQAWDPNPTDPNRKRIFLRYIVPKISDSAAGATAGKDVDWYEPWHNGLNLFSYPRKVADTRDYPQGANNQNPWWQNTNRTIWMNSTNQIIGNDGETTLDFTIKTTGSTEKLSSIQHTISGYLTTDPQFGHLFGMQTPIDLDGGGSFGSKTVTDNDNSSLNAIKMNWPGATTYKSTTGATSADQKFTVDSTIYTSDTGTFSLAYAVSGLKSADSKLWGDGSPYYRMADPALNLPSYYANNGGDWEENDAARESGRIRAMQLVGESVFTKEKTRGQAVPMGSKVTGSLRIYNYSFVPTGQVTVFFKFQPINAAGFQAPDISKATIDLGQTTINTIAGREQDATSDNWNDLSLDFNAPTQVGLGYLHVALETVPVGRNEGVLTGGNLNTANDQGHILVGIYDPQTIPAAKGAKDSAPGPKSLKVVAGSLAVLPINADRTLGHATTALSAGQRAIIAADIRFDDETGAATSGLFDIDVYLRSGKQILSHRSVPMLLNGKGYTAHIPYTAPNSVGNVPLEMLVTSAFLPPAADSNPAGRTAKMALTITQP